MDTEVTLPLHSVTFDERPMSPLRVPVQAPPRVEPVVASDQTIDPTALSSSPTPTAMFVFFSHVQTTQPNLLAMNMHDAREHFERAYLAEQYRLVDGKVSALAKIVDIERTHLYRKLRSLGILKLRTPDASAETSTATRVEHAEA